MLTKNMGWLDRSVRVVAGTALLLTGIWWLGGAQGDPAGIGITAYAIVPIVTGATGYCPGYIPFGISTRRNRGATSALDAVEASARLAIPNSPFEMTP